METRPRRAGWLALLVVLFLAAWEASFWPRLDFPGALWHQERPGIDIELGHARAAAAGWKEIAGFWTGRMLHGFPYYRPLPSCLFVAEERLFGSDDRKWAWVNLALHLTVVAALFWAAAALSSGSRLRRLSTGALAALLFAGPLQADREIADWVLTWWPAQSEILSLLFGLLLLGAAASYRRTGERRWVVLAPICFFFAVASKEIGYLAGIGACLILLPLPPIRRSTVIAAGNSPTLPLPRTPALPLFRSSTLPLLAMLALEGISLYLMRWWAVGTTAGAELRDWRNARLFGLLLAPRFTRSLLFPPWELMLVAAGCLALFALARRRFGTVVGAGLALAVFLLLGMALLGPPVQETFRGEVLSLLAMIGTAAIAAGLAFARREAPILPLLAVYLLTGWIVAGFPLTLGWYRYWNSAFGSLLAAIAMTTLAARVWRRAPAR